MTKQRIDKRFWAKVQRGDEQSCWPFIGYVSPNGYAQFYMGRCEVTGKRFNKMAHRVAYELVRGPIPDKLVLDHLCRNAKCCNPNHLEAVTQKINVLRGEGPSAKNALKTHCVKGHEYTPENTYIKKLSGREKRECRTCRESYRAKYRANH